MDKEHYNRFVGEAIKERRKELGHVQDNFSFANDIDRGYYWKIENGRINISVWQLYLLCGKLNTTPAQILSRAEELANEES